VNREWALFAWERGGIWIADSNATNTRREKREREAQSALGKPKGVNGRIVGFTQRSPGLINISQEGGDHS